MKKQSIFIAFLICLVAASAAQAQQIKGKIVDVLTGNGIADVEVSASFEVGKPGYTFVERKGPNDDRDFVGIRLITRNCPPLNSNTFHNVPPPPGAFNTCTCWLRLKIRTVTPDCDKPAWPFVSRLV